MPKRSLHHSTPWSVRFLCLLLSGLTACGPMNSKYTWHDVTAPKPTGTARSSPILDNWGADAESPNVMDPQIAPGFLLSLHSLADSKLNGDWRVDFDGVLQVPYDKTINTTGMTLSDLKRKLADVYRPYFKTPSDIDLKLKERRYWVDVRGLVDKPGRYLVESGASIDQLLGMAGGANKETPPLYVRIQKGQKIFVFDLNRYYSQGEDKPKILGWYGGDIVFFQKEMGGLTGERTPSSPYRLPIYMLGEVRKPGEYTLNPGSDFLDSLVLAGGFTEKADLDNIEIVRRTAGRKRVYNFSWNDLQQAPTPFQGDVIYVHADNITKTERHTALAATIVAAFASIVTSVVLILAYNKGRISGRLMKNTPNTEMESRLQEYIRYAELKELAYQIAALQQAKMFHSLAVLSVFPGEGKTLFSAAMAMAYAETCRTKVLVVDTTTIRNKNSLILNQCFNGSSPLVEILSVEELRGNAGRIGAASEAGTRVEKGVALAPVKENEFSLLKKVAEDRSEQYGLVLLDTAALSSRNRSNIEPTLVARVSHASVLLVSRQFLDSPNVHSTLTMLKDPTLHLIGMVANEGYTS